MTGRFSWTNSN